MTVPAIAHLFAEAARRGCEGLPAPPPIDLFRGSRGPFVEIAGTTGLPTDALRLLLESWRKPREDKIGRAHV